MENKTTPVKHFSIGFTLLELLTVLSIMGILLAIGIPSFRSFIQSQHIITASNDFFHAINLARSEAVQRGQRVDLLSRQDNNWESGWIIQVHKDNEDGSPHPDGDIVVLRHDPLVEGLTVTTILTDNTRQYIAYNGTGRSRTNSNSQQPQVGVWKFTLNDKTRLVKVGFLGRPRVCNPDAEPKTCLFDNTSD